mmetsp:Transcript_26382/g.53578  ORF Transcript_26382/g.53578 Transcript_26382/m.53578 type:complete len:143 (-) Transcript_26382:824-1252(-)
MADDKKGTAGSNGLPSSLSAMMKEMDDCDRPACEDTVSALTAALRRVGKKGGPATSASSSSKGSASTRPAACPPTSGVLGKSSWNLVHSMVSFVKYALSLLPMYCTYNECDAFRLLVTNGSPLHSPVVCDSYLKRTGGLVSR